MKPPTLLLISKQKIIISHLVLLLLILCDSIYSQDRSILIEYKTQFNQGVLKSLLSNLEYSDGKSIFKWNDTINSSTYSEDDYGNNKFHIDITDSIGTVNLTDYKKDSIYTRSLWLKDILVVKEKRQKIKWKIDNESTKKIGIYLAYKAIARFRGRDYVAWFTKEIPVSIGPWKLSGLPGLILEAYDEERMVYFIFNQLCPMMDTPLMGEEIFNQQKVMSLEQYKELQNKFAEDLIKKFISKMPKGVEISVDSIKEDYLEREF